MSLLKARAVAGLICLNLLSVAQGALAAPCGRPDVDFALPPDDASNVPGNAQLIAHYASPALYDDEPVSLTDGMGNDVEAQVSYDEADSMLRVSPSSPLQAGFHQVVWPGLRSVSSGGVGRGSTIGFFVDDSIDAALPRFQGLSKLDWDLSRDRDPCLDRLEDRFVFDLELGEADDDGGRELLTVLVFQTEDPAASDAQPTKVALRALPENGKLEVRRPAKKAGKTCFAAVVQDLLGNVSGGGEVEVCAKTKRPPFFDGCAVSAVNQGTVAPHDARPWVGLAAFALGLGLLRRRGTGARSDQARALR